MKRLDFTMEEGDSVELHLPLTIKSVFGEKTVNADIMILVNSVKDGSVDLIIVGPSEGQVA